ncbi:MAG: hypothetical protein LQ343_004481 [Gyalolechia ehrenbergii]|nr:MAG: hypothetical protein LQ343_004481 [Gyalolechia ehrenbergii]
MAALPSPPLSIESEKTEQKLHMWQKFRLSRWLGREEQQSPCLDEKKDLPILSRPGFGRRLSRKVVPGLPRPPTFRRQNSERRERLKPVEPTPIERRAASVGRRRALSARPASPPPCSIPDHSAPETRQTEDEDRSLTRRGTCPDIGLQSCEPSDFLPPPPPPPPQPPPSDPPPPKMNDNKPPISEASFDLRVDDEIREELEKRWILNLSMHFRDHSPREKFFLTFLTYAEKLCNWRRVTVSCDYRDAPIDSLERDIQSLQFQRDKSARIYESIRSSLPEIQFYDTVTNLKLETREERLHVHITEDVNEIIPYPSVNAVQYLNCRRIPETDLCFESHMSGFVYKVSVDDEIFIKKEIPGPDSVDEFLYEINALTDLSGSNNVIQFRGLVVDKDNTVVKGLLISFAEQGALVDLLYDHKEEKERLPWARRERWAKQIVHGLAEIHEAGFVQGDFTLSNIVIDEHDEAKIIDINRRGCPVGWEPPEISRLVECSQRISMYIGVKSDLFQLGMVLWALAEGEDEPERQERPLLFSGASSIPQYYRDLVAIFLDPQPKKRINAKDLLSTFPELSNEDLRPISERQAARILSSSHKVYIDRSLPNTEDYDGDRDSIDLEEPPSNEHTYTDGATSIGLPFDGPDSYMVTGRGRTPPVNISHLSPPKRPSAEEAEEEKPQIVPVSPTGEHRWEEVEMDGTRYLVQRDSLELEDFRKTGRLPEAKRSKFEHLGGEVGHRFEHVDSGLADMDPVSALKHRSFQHVDSGLADMDLAGVSGGIDGLFEHGAWRGRELHHDDDCGNTATPGDNTNDTKLELDDRKTDDSIMGLA